MLNSWWSWCRLCANESSAYKLQSLDKLNEILMKLFNCSLNNLSEVCNCICEDCYHFVNQVDRFKKRYEQTSKMLLELSTTNDKLTDSDLQDMRYQFLGESLSIEREEILDRKSIVPLLDSVGSMKYEEGNIHMKREPIEFDDGDEALESSENNGIFMSMESNIEALEENFNFVAVEDEFNKVNSMHDLQEATYTGDNDTSIKALGTQENLDEMNYTMDKKRKTKFKSNDKSQVDQMDKATQSLNCEPCDMIFRTRTAYIKHLRSTHPGSEKPLYSCSKCPKRFFLRFKLKLHESMHLPDDKKFIHPCHFCDKKFKSLVYVRAHIKSVHIKERSLICEECGKTFATNASLKVHQIAHTDETPHQCAHCSKEFKTLSSLRAHEDVHNDRYVCSVCNATLNTKRTLRMHMLVHTDQKRFKCEHCGKEYKRAKALKSHLIIHTGLRPYQCPFCEKTYANGSNCRSHKKKAHPEELAALEASGKQSPATNIPKLEHLRSK